MRQADVEFSVRTDLALEERERIRGSESGIPGIRVQEREKKEGKIRVTEVAVCDERGAAAMGKPVGLYLTLEAPSLAKKDEDYHRDVSEELAELLRKLFEEHGLDRDRMGRPVRTLVVGLGNPEATPDSLGPKVLEHLQATRHLELEYGVDFCRKHGYPVLSGITPGVMAQTGMETAEIVRGIVQETEPDAVIVVDALAARSAGRLGITVQLSDTGIQPGSGVGNHRSGLTEETLGIPVFAIGIPMVVGAAAIVYDTVGAMTEVLREQIEDGIRKTENPEHLQVEEVYELVRELLKPDLGPMYVTPHDIDERVDFLSFTISEALHGALFEER
ncbi:GPR endopeptidase [Clostridium sp. AM30-24]|nr:GPR endopeptidase [Clostridium sp. AM30-24]RHT43111.1 GPR endopeptidase [Clostridium sp. AM30-24]